MERIARKTLKIIGWILLSVGVLVVLAYFLIQIPGVQNFARSRVVIFLENKLKTNVEIEKLSINFPGRVVLKKVYFEDQNKDTLLAGEQLRVDINLFKLLANVVEVKNIELTGIRANIYRINSDTVFNYQYIVDAFGGKQSARSPDTSGAFKFNLDKISLNRVITSFRDDQSGNDAYINIGQLNTTINSFDPQKQEYGIPSFFLNNVTARIRQYKPLMVVEPMENIEAESNQTSAIKLQLNNIDFQNINFDYENSMQDIKTTIRLGMLSSDIKNIDLQNLTVDLDNLQLKNTDAFLHFGKSIQAKEVTKEVKKEVKAQVNNPWKIQVASVDFVNNNIRYENDNEPKLYRGIDYAHLDIQSLWLQADHLVFMPSRFEGNIQQLALREKSGLSLRKTQANFIYSDKEITVKDLWLQTDRTLLRDYVSITFDSIGQLSKEPGKMGIEVNLDRSNISVKDVLLFVPALSSAPPFKNNGRDVFYVDAKITGFLSDLYVPRFHFTGLNNTKLKATGRITGLPNASTTLYDLTIQELNTNKEDLAILLPDNSIPPTIRLPNSLEATGVFKGTASQFNTRLRLNTDKGDADVTAFVQNSGKQYSIRGNVYNFDIGYIAKQEKNIGKITAFIDARGNGFDINQSTLFVNTKITAAYLYGYNYSNVNIEVELKKGMLTTTANSGDPNAAFSLTGTADLKKTAPSFNIQMNVTNVNLSAINLSKEPISIQTQLTADIPVADPDNLAGKINIQNIVVNHKGEKYNADSLTIYAGVMDGYNSIAIRSQALDANLVGQYKLTELAAAVQHTINQYYTLPGYEPQEFYPQNWTLTATVYAHPLLFRFAPQLKGSDSIVINSSYNSSENDLQLLTKAKKLVVNGQQLDSLTFKTFTTNDKLNYSATILQVQTPQLKLHRTTVTGFLANDQLTINLDVKDKSNRSRYQLSGKVEQVSDGVRFHLSQDSVMFDYERWMVGTNNYIQYTSKGILVNNFTISSSNQSLSIQSNPLEVNAPITADFKNFKISTITSIANQESLLLDGTINGNAVVRNAMTNPIFTSDIQITDFRYGKDTLGNIMVRVNNETTNTLAADIRLQGRNNDVQIAGKYFIEGGTMDMTMNMVNFDLANLKPLATGQLTDAGGSIRATASIKGTLADPQIEGNINFQNAFIAPAILGERFNLPNQELKITPDGINFDNFTLTDSTGNKAVIDGEVYTKNFRDYRFDLYLNTQNFRVLNKPKKINELFYGKLTLDSDLEIFGTIESPSIDGYVKVNKGTDFYFVLPGNNPELISREGVVQFVDMDNPDSALTTINADTVINYADLKGFEVFLSVETDTAAQFTLVVDERNGDELKLKGQADITTGIDKSGKLSIAGTYELQSGSYDISFNLLRRKFMIEEGSTVTWTGEPTSAMLDISAVYIANTSSIDLVYPQLVGRSPAEVNRYKQRLPFQVELNLTGELMKPVIQFDINLPETQAAQWKDVDEKLQDVKRDNAELNKQVFALLLLNRFVQENPFQSSGGSENSAIESFARQSVSRLLTEQLNQLAGSLIQGVDVNFGVASTEDYSTGEFSNRTDLTVNVSKRLLNDRLRVSIGNNFEIEGANNAKGGGSSLASDVAVDYQLSRDGRYLLRAYRRNTYETIVEGIVVETGTSFIFTLDFDSVKDLFRKNSHPVIRERNNKRMVRGQ